MTVKLLNERHLEFLSLKGGCTGWSKSILVKMSHCWKSHVTAHIYFHFSLKHKKTVHTESAVLSLVEGEKGVIFSSEWNGVITMWDHMWDFTKVKLASLAAMYK